MLPAVFFAGLVLAIEGAKVELCTSSTRTFTAKVNVHGGELGKSSQKMAVAVQNSKWLLFIQGVLLSMSAAINLILHWL